MCTLQYITLLIKEQLTFTSFIAKQSLLIEVEEIELCIILLR